MNLKPQDIEEPNYLKMHVVFMFGLNEDGQCGVPDKKDQKGIYFPVPVKFPIKTTIVSVSAGSRHTLALSSTGSVFSWGYGRQGQLGHGNVENQCSPTLIDGLSSACVKVISAGGLHSGCIDSNNTLYTWGSTTVGQLGLGKPLVEVNGKVQPAEYVAVPTAVKLVEEENSSKESPFLVTKLSCGGMHTAAIDIHGDVYCWGKADSGQTGYSKWYLDFSSNVNHPRKVYGFEGKGVEVSCGGFHTLILNNKGNVYAMGKEDFGQLGTGLKQDNMSVGAEVPTLIQTLYEMHVVSIHAGGWHNTFLTDDGQLFTCGKGEYGRLGVGSEKSKIEPTLVNCHQINLLDSPHLQLSPKSARSRKSFMDEEDVNYVKNPYNIVHVSAGGSHTIWATQNHDIYSVGRVDSGRLGMGSHCDKKLDRTINPTCISKNIYRTPKAKVVEVVAGGAHSAIIMEYPEVVTEEECNLLFETIQESCVGR